MERKAIRGQIRDIVRNIPPPFKPKCGNDLQVAIAAALSNAGFFADTEDKRAFLKPFMPVWRDKNSRKIQSTTRRRKIDIVVYKNDRPIALIETESDLDDLCMEGVKKRNGHYDVWSIAQPREGEHFNSYKSLERMAAAAFYFHLQERDGNYPNAAFARETLESIRSDVVADHNPQQFPMFLVSGWCRAGDEDILKPRLISLGAELICLHRRSV